MKDKSRAKHTQTYRNPPWPPSPREDLHGKSPTKTISSETSYRDKLFFCGEASFEEDDMADQEETNVTVDHKKWHIAIRSYVIIKKNLGMYTLLTFTLLVVL